MPVPTYSARVSGGWLTLRTSQATLRYKVGSGPFTAANTSVRFADGENLTTVHPTWDWECPFDQTCQAGAAVLRGGATLSYSQSGYQSSAGYVGNLVHRGASATWSVLGAPPARARLSIRYSNVAGPHASSRSHDLDLMVNGHLLTTLTAVPTAGAQPWSTLTTTASLTSGRQLRGGAVRLPTTAATWISTPCRSVPSDASVPAPVQTDPLGGWIRGFDTFTYEPLPPCAPGTARGHVSTPRSSRCTPTDCSTVPAGGCSTTPRAHCGRAKDGSDADRRGGDVEDGYLFVYGQDYAGALRTFAQLTGSAPLLPRNVFGVWYSDYTPYSSRYIENSLYPAFQRNDVPLNTLSLDTDWKAPNNWDGWEWNTSLFPAPGRLPAMGPCQGYRRHLEHPLEHRRRRPQGAHRASSRRDDAGQVELHGRDLQGSGTGARSPRPSPTSPSSRASRTRAWRSGGWTGAVTRRSCPCPG